MIDSAGFLSWSEAVKLERHESREAATAHGADHLSIEDLANRYRSCVDACSRRHYQTIWLLAQGHTIAEVSDITRFVPRWIEEPLCRSTRSGRKRSAIFAATTERDLRCSNLTCLRR